jgi:hypothetical protein
MLYLLIGVLIGIVITALPFIFWIGRAKAGELQIYHDDDSLFPVISVNSRADFEKRYMLLKTRDCGSRK